jgi:hypothetical protein
MTTEYLKDFFLKFFYISDLHIINTVLNLYEKINC